MSAETVWM